YPSILDRIVGDSNDPGVLNAVACSPRARLATLRRIESSDYAPSIRQHAKLNIVSRHIERMPRDDLLRILSESSGDDGSSLGIRELVARSKHAPNDILELLLLDDADFVREAAAAELRRRNDS